MTWRLTDPQPQTAVMPGCLFMGKLLRTTGFFLPDTYNPFQKQMALFLLRRPVLLASTLLCLSPLVLPLVAQRPQTDQRAVYISFADARQVVSTLAEILPDELKGKSEREIAAAWPAWLARYDAKIRARLTQGDEDSLANFLLFGTSFTRHPRVTLEQLQSIRDVGTPIPAGPSSNEQANPVPRLIDARITDLVSAVASLRGNGNDRLLFVRKIIGEKGFHVETREGREQARQYLATSLQRVMNENAGYARALEAASVQGDASEEFAERSRLFRVRGLSSDTSLLPNYAIEESLKEIKTRGLLASASVRRVAVIGPGLDFTDKQEGYDFYPQQTIQPFAVIDTLLRLGLANADALQVVTFDLSPRVNDHLARARDRALHGQVYVVQLPRDALVQWKPDAVRYWERFGDQIGSVTSPVVVPAAAGQLKIRAVRVRTSLVSRVKPVDTNIVLQRLDLPEGEKFDLMIATNVFVYYDNFDQSLAMINVERMLKPAGLLLSNNALLELPFFKVHSAGYSTVIYSDRPNDGDHIVWYRRSSE